MNNEWFDFVIPYDALDLDSVSLGILTTMTAVVHAATEPATTETLDSDDENLAEHTGRTLMSNRPAVETIFGEDFR